MGRLPKLGLLFLGTGLLALLSNFRGLVTRGLVAALPTPAILGLLGNTWISAASSRRPMLVIEDLLRPMDCLTVGLSLLFRRPDFLTLGSLMTQPI